MLINQERFPEMDLEFEKMRKRWYQTENVVFNIIESLKYRETCFYRKRDKDKCMIRLLKCNAIIYLIKNFERYHFFNEPFNMYQSIGIYPNMPMFSFIIKTKQEQHEQFWNNIKTYNKGYDFFLDIDNPDLRLAYSIATKTKEIFDRFKVPYSLIFSGKKGFHFIVKYNDFPESLKSKNYLELINLFQDFAYQLSTKENLFDVDLTIYDDKRICKTPYSVVYPDYLIALPLSDEQFNDFSIKEVSLPYWLERTDQLYLRGLLKRKGTGDNFLQMIDHYTKNLNRL